MEYILMTDFRMIHTHTTNKENKNDTEDLVTIMLIMEKNEEKHT